MVVLTPPLGWNTWNTFGCDINEKLVLEAAQIMISSGLHDAGYEYESKYGMEDYEIKHYHTSL